MNLKNIVNSLTRAFLQRLAIVGSILLYWVISITMVFFNKYLVGNRTDTQDISLFVAWIQCIVCVLFISLSSRVTKVWDPNNSEVVNISFKSSFSRSMVLFSVFFVLMLTFNNLCLKYVGVAFFQLARSLTLIFTVILSAIILRKNVSIATVLCCLVVVSGFFLAVDQEHYIGSLSVIGVSYGILTSLFVALCGIMLKFNLDKFSNDSVKVTLHNNFNAVILFMPLLLVTGEISSASTSEVVHEPRFWCTLIASGVFSFLMSWSSALQVQYTSPITHHISNNTKSVVQTLIAVIYYKDTKPVLWWVSNTLVICGALAYAIVQMSENSTKEEIVSPSLRKSNGELNSNISDNGLNPKGNSV